MVEQSTPIKPQRHLKEKAIEEFKQFIIIFIYLWAVLA